MFDTYKNHVLEYNPPYVQSDFTYNLGSTFFSASFIHHRQQFGLKEIGSLIEIDSSQVCLNLYALEMLTKTSFFKSKRDHKRDSFNRKFALPRSPVCPALHFLLQITSIAFPIFSPF